MFFVMMQLKLKLFFFSRNHVGHGLQLKVEKDHTEQHKVEKPAFVMVLDWSACSPDLSSIDNGWQIMNHNKYLQINVFQKQILWDICYIDFAPHKQDSV